MPPLGSFTILQLTARFEQPDESETAFELFRSDEFKSLVHALAFDVAKVLPLAQVGRS